MALRRAPASAAAADYAHTALNIIPSGQYGGLPPPDGADDQALMYDGLTPLFDQVTPAHLTQYFKSERFGIATAGPGMPESVPRPGVTIVRDQFNVPHVTASTYNGGIWAAGWIATEDRFLLGQQARYNARVAAIDAPGLSALGLISGLQNFQPSAQTEAEIAKQTQVLQNAGPEGEAVLRDIDTFISGINDNLEINHPSTAPWTRNDVYAVNALKGQFVGEGGGDEARRSQFLAGLQQRLGQYRGKSVFDDLRQFKNPESPTSVDGTFNYGQLPSRPQGSVILDPGSYEPTPAVAESALPEESACGPEPGQQHPDDRRGPLEDRVSADGRRPADRLLLPRPHLRDRHARARAPVAGSDLRALPRLHADRPRRGLRHHAHLGEQRHHRPVRRDALPEAATRGTSTRGSAGRWATSMPAHSTASRSSS